MSIIASSLELTRKDLVTLKVTDPYSMHRVIYGLFEDIRSEADKLHSKPSGFLYAEVEGDHHARRFIMISDRQPAETCESGVGRVISKAIDPSFLEHEQYSFKIVVNPTQTDKATGKRVPVRGLDNIRDWFARKAPQQWGFTVDPDRLLMMPAQIEQFQAKKGNKVTVAKAYISGSLTVTDQEAFRKSFTQGIGRSRAFGCGLLQIVPVKHNPFSL